MAQVKDAYSVIAGVISSSRFDSTIYAYDGFIEKLLIEAMKLKK